MFNLVRFPASDRKRGPPSGSLTAVLFLLPVIPLSDKGKAAYDCKDRGGEVLVEGGADVVRQSEHYHKADDSGHYMDNSECSHCKSFLRVYKIVFKFLLLSVADRSSFATFVAV